jgi:hypothetical protein
MADSEFSLAFTAWMLATNHSAFRITLRTIDGYEGFESREFDLCVGGTFPIGRASKNTTKKTLMPAPSNAYIDSPVISREHALLSADTQLGTPHVYITDTGSMHGTMVNDERLPPHTPKQLASGDKLQFGIDVNRNEGTHSPHAFPCLLSPCNADMPSLPEFFVARKYEFKSSLVRPQAPFSLGFTVPDSDEEEVGGTTLRRGSQTNPLTIHESDSESDVSDNEIADLTMMDQTVIVVDDEEERPTVASIHLHQKSSASADEVALVEEIYSENESGGGYYSSDGPDDDLNGEESVMGDSVADYSSVLPSGSDFGASDDEMGPTPVPADRQPEAEPKEAEVTLEQSATAFADRILPYTSSGAFESVQPELPSMDMIRESHDAFNNSFPPPLPPRPAAAQPSMFDRAELPSSSRPPWFSDEIASYPTYMGTNHGDRPILFSPAPVPPYMPSSQEMKNMGFGGSSMNFPAFASRMQTPPPMQPSDVTTSTTPPPSRRTKVSIGEIVEEQPPTPTSVNNMKRKADVLDESDVSVPDVSTRSESLDSTRTDQPADAQSNSGPTPAQTAAIIAQRPKKQPRSILGRLRTTATYLGVGAAGAAGMVALLSSLPDAFFA